ncbi:Sec-independent protein translocase subunit TatB [Rhodococcus spelaei]|uniref:Sec-independent protein translocase protein TatB n=1 Tax=Rhodococcus spelaei TaxID=2546320 RepID=A0A541AZP9_9NOCA|nr:Sec-independent protein translocase protein TatB [Rhodococcus spelaei]TQF65540.1 Sec-independent protein translocase subunit TatB [Rhodococcus spelaei]
MFGNIGWGEFMVLLVAALVILGPERLPGAVTWVTKSLRQVRDYASGATAQLKDELGPEFEDLRKPLSDLQQLRGMTPRTVITKHLLDGDDSLFKDLDVTKSINGNGSGATGLAATRPEPKPLESGERPPFDADAT